MFLTDPVRNYNVCAKNISNGAGFTLIELLITIVVVGIAAVPLSLLISQHIESAFNCEDQTIAFNLARFEMERVNNMNYANIVDASFSHYQGYSYDVNRAVTYVSGNPSSAESLRKITVIVNKTGGSSVLASLVTYIAKNVSYGL